MPGVTVYPAWMAHDELRRFNVVIDLNDVPARREIEFWPVDMEAALHELFALPVPDITALAPVPRQGGPLRIGILPLASSPMRTLPPGLVLGLANGLCADGMAVESFSTRSKISRGCYGRRWMPQGRICVTSRTPNRWRTCWG